MLKLVMAVSKDHFVARGPDDDMGWTGEQDKKAFRLLTMVGGVMGAGRRTFDLLSRTVLQGRKLVCISREGEGYAYKPVEGWGGYEETLAQCPRMSLGHFACNYPGAWLIGGPTVAYEAVSACLIDEIHLCKVDEYIGAKRGDTPIPLWHALGQDWGKRFVRAASTKLDGVEVTCYRRKT